jgi:predicted Zn-dependent peptidase
MIYKKTTLKNGLRIITVPMKEAEAVTVMVLVSAGSDYETKEINGLSHFLEHMCFQGTTKRPNTGDISRELDSLGAQSNAFTGEEYTGYYAKAHKKHISKLVDLVSDIYLNPILDEKAMEREKGVVIEEMKMYEDMPHVKSGEVFEELLYGDQPAGWSIIGKENVVRSLTSKQIRDYQSKHYVASGTIVVVSGAIDEKKVVKEVSERFNGISKSKKHKKIQTTESQSAPSIKIFKKNTDQAHVALGFRTFPIKHKDNVKIKVLEAVLGHGMSSRLFKRLRDEMGICYYVRSGNSPYLDRGYFAVTSGLSKDRVEEGIKAILEEVNRLKKELVSKEELEKAKEVLVGNMYLSLETSDSYADFYAFQDLMGQKIKTPKEKEASIRKVTSKDVQKIANQIFKNETLNLAVVGPFEDSKTFKKILSL